MASAERALMKSLLSTMTEESLRARYEDVLSTPNHARRAVVLALHNLAVRQPKLVASMLALPYSEHQWEHIGSGVDSTVFKINAYEVLKINRWSVHASSLARQEFVARRKVEHKKMARTLGHFVVPHTSMQVGPHPVMPTIEVVTIRQPYMQFTDPKLIHPANPDILAEKIDALKSRNITICDQLGDFVERSRFLYSRHALLPDICGPANLVLVEERDIRQIDGLPVSADQPATQQAINGYLDMMTSAIALA